MQGMTETAIDTIRDDFSFLDDWEDRYRYIIELGERLAPYPEAARDAVHKVQGCVSQVWLLTKHNADRDPILEFQGDSDAHIVRGLVAIMMALFSGKRASEILRIDAEATLREFGLDEHLSPQRANGLRAMIKRIKREADGALAGVAAPTA
jgi:cysteine desulfuration protein SufE